MNQRRYGSSTQSSLKIPSGNLQQFLHLGPPPSATITFPPLLTTPSPLFLTPPTPTHILIKQTTSTTQTPLHQPHSLSPLLHPSYPTNNHAVKRQKTLLAPLPQSSPPRPSTHLHLPSCPRNHVPKGQNNLPRSPSQRETHPHSVRSFPLISG